MKKLLTCGLLLGTIVAVGATTAQAAPLHPDMEKNGEAKIEFTSVKIEDGGLVFVEVPSFNFGIEDLNETGFSLTTTGQDATYTNDKGFVVKDLRGGNDGYKVKMEVQHLENGTYKLPITTFAVNTAEQKITDIFGTTYTTHSATSVNNVFRTADHVVRSTKDSNGQLESALPEADIEIGAGMIKAGQYKGNIDYTLEDANLTGVTP